MYSYDDLILFSKLAEIGNFTKTAKILKLSHTTISRRIKSLEDRLGISLISYRGNSFMLTDEGKEILNYLRPTLSSLEESMGVVNAIIQNNKIPATRLRVILPPTLSEYKISPFLPEFLRKFPEIKLDIYYHATEIDLVRNGVDVAITHIYPHYQSQKVRSIYKTTMKLYCTKAYANKYGIPKNLEELSQHLYVSFSGDFFEKPLASMPAIDSNGDIVLIPNNSQIRGNHSKNMISMLKSGEVIIAAYDFEDINIYEEVITVLPEYKVFPYEYFLLKHPHVNSRASELFVEFLLSLFNE